MLNCTTLGIALAKENTQCQKPAQIEGIGPVGATALVAAVGNAKEFAKE
jgi:hypothetical protein